MTENMLSDSAHIIWFFSSWGFEALFKDGWTIPTDYTYNNLAPFFPPSCLELSFISRQNDNNDPQTQMLRPVTDSSQTPRAGNRAESEMSGGLDFIGPHFHLWVLSSVAFGGGLGKGGQQPFFFVLR